MTTYFEATAGPNLALIKYFGKRDDEQNVPATPSLGLTVAGFSTRTRVERLAPGMPDTLRINGEDAGPHGLARAARIYSQLGRVGERPGLAAVSHNDFPTAAGLASSSSGMAALAAVSAAALGSPLRGAALAALARLGSGSAARACFGGWVSLETDGSSAQVARGDELPVEVVACLVEAGTKPLGSGAAMERARATSPIYADWLAQGRRDMDEALAALARRDLPALFACSERNTAYMHELLARCPLPVAYATARTRQVLGVLEEARRAFGAPMAVTRDAGPNPFVIVPAGEGPRLATLLDKALQGHATQIVVLQAGEGPEVHPVVST